jgi:hypothetical protein
MIRAGPRSWEGGTVRSVGYDAVNAGSQGRPLEMVCYVLRFFPNLQDSYAGVNP